jgi:uncharacterized protein YecE (DUF72 family)
MSSRSEGPYPSLVVARSSFMVPTDSAEAPAAEALFVGTPLLRGDIGRYAKRFDLLEVSAEPGRHPRRAGLLAMRREVPGEFVFSVAPSSALVSLESGERADDLVRESRAVADALEARWWVLRTPPSVTPSARSTRALEALVEKLAASGRGTAWEPRGIWRDDEASRVARSLGITLVRDLLREELDADQAVVYTRIRALGEGAHVGSAGAERIAERLSGANEAYVVVEGSGAVGVRKVLRESFGLGADGAATEGEDDEDSEEDLDDEFRGDEEEDSFE